MPRKPSWKWNVKWRKRLLRFQPARVAENLKLWLPCSKLRWWRQKIHSPNQMKIRHLLLLACKDLPWKSDPLARIALWSWAKHSSDQSPRSSLLADSDRGGLERGDVRWGVVSRLAGKTWGVGVVVVLRSACRAWQLYPHITNTRNMASTVVDIA